MLRKKLSPLWIACLLLGTACTPSPQTGGTTEERLLLEEAQKRGVTLSSNEREKILSQLRLGYSHEEFEEFLRKNGQTISAWEENQLRNRLIEKMVSRLLQESGPSESALQEMFRRQPDLYQRPERSHCRQIVTASREKAEKILELLKQGDNFAALAQQYSESPDRKAGGDLGWVARGDLPPILDEACFRFRPGQTSGVVTSAYGFHIFRVLEKEPSRRLTFAEARPMIEESWREENRERILKEWFSQKKGEAP